MKKNSEHERDISYEAISAELLGDYEPVILPVIYGELESDEQPVENGYLCIGARVDGQPAAAIVVYLEQYGDLDLQSLFVRTQYRRMGIASALTERVLQVAAATFQFEEPQEVISFKTVYALPPQLKQPWEAFLRADGFNLPGSVGKTYELDSRDLALSRAFAPAFAGKVTFEPREDEAIAIAITEDTPGRFFLEQADAAENVSRRRWLHAMQAAIADLAKDGQPFTLIITDAVSYASEVWEEAMGVHSRRYEQCVAWQEIELTRRSPASD